MGCAIGGKHLPEDVAQPIPPPVEPAESAPVKTTSRSCEEWGFASASVASQEEIDTIGQHVIGYLDYEWPGLKNSSLLSTWRERDQLMRRIGPPMVLLSWRTIKELGHIPHSSEGKAISLQEASDIAEQAGKRFFIEMFSHRWCSPGAMDDVANSKAAALVQWGEYRWSIGLATFFWVDFACINQNDIRPGIAMLPLYVASCNNIVCYDTEEYEPRAWCRLERVMFCAFVAPNNEFIGSDFTYDPEAERLPNRELKPIVEERAVLPDPETGALSFASDSQLIRDLKSLCGEHWGKCWKDGLMETAQERGKLADVRSLRFGATQVRMRRFSSGTRKPSVVDRLPFMKDIAGSGVSGKSGDCSNGTTVVPADASIHSCTSIDVPEKLSERPVGRRDQEMTSAQKAADQPLLGEDPGLDCKLNFNVPRFVVSAFKGPRLEEGTEGPRRELFCGYCCSGLEER